MFSDVSVIKEYRVVVTTVVEFYVDCRRAVCYVAWLQKHVRWLS